MPIDQASHILRGPANLIAGQWHPILGDSHLTVNPAFPEQRIFACSPRVSDVNLACAAARKALPAWSQTPRDKRFAVLRRFADIAKSRQSLMADLLCDEIGKALWESKQEAALLSGKVDITLDPAPEGGLHRVSDFEFALSPSRIGRCTFKPHGVMGVIGPFNFPAHLPNGHIVPALAMGNTIVFKPSDKAMAVGQQLADWFDEALRAEDINILGVFNLVQGGADVASALATNPELDAIAFTGSWPVGKKILQANLDQPGRIIALELGGSNPAVFLPDCDLRLAAIELARSAFATTGQRCTCTRRAIIHRDIADRLISAVCKIASTLSVGQPRATHPVFMGPINNDRARADLLNFQSRAQAAGAEVLVRSSALDTPGSTSKGFFITPSILRVDRFTTADALAPGEAGFDAGCDTEIFGPLLRIAIVNDFDDAIAQSNATRYGLAAAIFTKDRAAAARFVSEVRAGCINVNAGTAGASSKLPFGGLGWSGNHRPAGSFALDYCATPVASMLESSDAAALPEGMMLEDAWLK